MMKPILSLAFLFLTFAGLSQNYQIEPTVVEIDSASASEIYSAVKLMIAENYNNASEVIQLDDPENGILVLKGSSENYSEGLFGEHTPAGTWYYTAKFEVKDGRYRYSVTDFILSDNWGDKNFTTNGRRPQAFSRTRLEELIADLSKLYASVSVDQTSDDW